MKTDLHLTDLNPDQHLAYCNAIENGEWRDMVTMAAQAACDRVHLENGNAHLEFYELLLKIGVDRPR